MPPRSTAAAAAAFTRSTLPALAGALLWCSAAANARAAAVDLEHVASIAWPTGAFGPVQTFTRMVAGDISGDGSPDAVALSGTKVVFFHDIAYHTAQSLVPRAANDIDIAPRAAPGQRDALALVTPYGLEVLHWVHGDEVTPGSFISAPIVGGIWVDARIVRSGFLNGTGAADYVGLAADSKTLIRQRDGESPATLTLLRDVLDMAIVEWQAGAPPAIVVLTAAAVVVYDQDWGVIASWPHMGVPGGAITVVHADGKEDRVAWVFEDPNGMQHLSVVSEDGGMEEPLDLPVEAHAIALAAGDVDNDGDDDLFASHQHDYGPFYFENRTYPEDPNSDDTFIAPHTIITGTDASLGETDGAANQARPLVMDLDLDGYADIVVPVQAAASFSIFLRDHAPGEALTQTFFLEYSEFAQPDGTNNRELKLKIKFESFPFDPLINYVEVVIWAQHEGPLGPMIPTSYEHRLYSTDGGDPSGEDAAATLTMPMEENDHAECFDSIYWFEVRAAKQTANGITALGETYIAGLASYEGWISDMTGLYGWIYMDNTPECIDGQQLGGGGQRAPAIVPNRRLPDFETGVVPQVKPPVGEPIPLIYPLPP